MSSVVHWKSEDRPQGQRKGPEMTVATPQSSLLTYDDAARLLGIQRASVKQLVARGRLHSLPAPEDRRRRLLTRTEVEAYAREHAGKWSYGDSVSPQSV